MGKQFKKAHPKKQKINKWQKTCERCGNELFTPNKVFRCKYCGQVNGLKNQ